MRLVSNKESVARSEVSILAIAETLCAIALVFYLSSHFNTLRWLAVAMCVSPLLLLRTKKSMRLGVEWFNRGFESSKTYEPDKLRNAFYLPPPGSGYFVRYILPFLVRFGATFVATIRHPIEALRAIPRNWFVVCFATDTCSPPEIVPQHPIASFSAALDLAQTVVHASPFWARRLMGVGCVLLFFPLFVPALLYRWSLKATTIIYAPLVFVAHSTFSEGADLRTKLELIKRSDLSRIRVWYGVIAIVAFLVKLVLMMNLPGFADWWDGHPVSQFLALYVAPAEIPKWQLAELANSVLAIGGMLFARRALLGYELQHPWPEVPVKRLLGFVSSLRWVLALYAILCTGYITMRAAQHWHWPALGEQWLPW